MRYFPSLRTAALLTAAGLLAAVATADDVTVIKKHINDSHTAKIVIAGDGDTEIFEVDGELEVGESRQFFTESGKEIVITRTDEGFDMTIDGESLDTGLSNFKFVHFGNEGGSEGGNGNNQIHISNGSKIKIMQLGSDGEIELRGDSDAEMNYKVIRLGGGDGEHVEVGSGHNAIFISTDGEHSDADHVWISADDVNGYTFGDHKTAIEHLESSGALDKLDAETREKVLEALRTARDEAQNP